MTQGLLHLDVFLAQATDQCDKVARQFDHCVELVFLLKESLSLLHVCTMDLVPHHLLFQGVVISIFVFLAHQ